MRVMQPNTVKIIKDYKYTIKGNPSAPIGQIGGASREDITFTFKAGQIVEGYISDKNEIQVRVGNNFAIIPKENWEFVNKEQNATNQSISVKPPTEIVNLSPSANLSSEEKFYQSLGLKDRGGWSPTAKAKGRFLVAVVLVAGYFAYKKFKK